MNVQIYHQEQLVPFLKSMGNDYPYIVPQKQLVEKIQKTSLEMIRIVDRPSADKKTLNIKDSILISGALVKFSGKLYLKLYQIPTRLHKDSVPLLTQLFPLNLKLL